MQQIRETYLEMEDALCKAECLAGNAGGFVIRQSVQCSIMPAIDGDTPCNDDINAFYVYGNDNSILGIFAYKKRSTSLPQNLPEFSFLEDFIGSGSVLQDRNVILHLPTCLLIEIVYRGDVVLSEKQVSLPLVYTNCYGGEMPFVAYVHQEVPTPPTLAATDIEKILQSAIVWFKDFCRWEDLVSEEI